MEKKNENPFKPKEDRPKMTVENMFTGDDDEFLGPIMGSKIQGATAIAKMAKNEKSMFYADNKLNQKNFFLGLEDQI